MPDDKRGREAQADHADRRQRERDVAAAQERSDEPEPPLEDPELEAALEPIAFPATGAEIVAAAGDREVGAPDRTYRIAELVPDADAEAFEEPAAVRARVERPTVATAMKRIVEASAAHRDASLGGSQREAYEKTFRALGAIDAVDEDDGIRAVADWIVAQLRDDGTLPGSRAVRRRAAEYCRANGYQVRNDEWLGI